VRCPPAAKPLGVSGKFGTCTANNERDGEAESGDEILKIKKK
jgi:hypothetical protein